MLNAWPSFLNLSIECDKTFNTDPWISPHRSNQYWFHWNEIHRQWIVQPIIANSWLFCLTYTIPGLEYLMKLYILSVEVVLKFKGDIDYSITRSRVIVLLFINYLVIELIAIRFPTVRLELGWISLRSIRVALGSKICHRSITFRGTVGNGEWIGGGKKKGNSNKETWMFGLSSRYKQEKKKYRIQGEAYFYWGFQLGSLVK